jgi:stage II sporulation protein D
LRQLLLSILLLGILFGFFCINAGICENDSTSFSGSIRVAIAKNASIVTINGDGVIATRENGVPVALSSPVTAIYGRDGVVIDGKSFRRITFAAASAILVNGKPYRGTAELSQGDKGILVVNELPLEDYLVGLINCEISSAWPIEAVKSQAIIARTYALNRREARNSLPYHLESSVIDQVYEGCEIEDSRARRGVSETAGQVLTYNGSIIQAFYHSNCGGRTEAAENVWGARLPYMMGVDCQYCLTNPSTSWELKLSFQDMEDKLKSAGYKVLGISDIRPGVRNLRGRLKNVQIISTRGEVTLTGDQFRKVLGYGLVKSTNFTVRIVSGEALFSGLGNGHGVGLCQWGSKQRALDGFGYAEILSYYYPGTELRKFSEIR